MSSRLSRRLLVPLIGLEGSSLSTERIYLVNTWVDVGGGFYRMVSKHGCAHLGLCVDHAFMLVAYLFFMHVFHVLVSFAWC